MVTQATPWHILAVNYQAGTSVCLCRRDRAIVTREGLWAKRDNAGRRFGRLFANKTVFDFDIRFDLDQLLAAVTE